MTFGIELSICVIAWTLTAARFRAIHWKDIRSDNGIALNVWLMMVFFSITSVFLIKRFCDFFDAYTFNNLDRLIAYSSILAGMTFGSIAAVNAVGKPSEEGMTRWLHYSLGTAIVMLVVVYGVYLSRIPNINYFVPRSVPEALFMFVTFSFAVLLCATVVRAYVAYLPSEQSPIMRTRSLLIIVSTSAGCAYFLVKIALIGGYFWPFLASQALIDLSWALLVFTAFSHFSALLSNKIYVRLVVISKNIRSWSTFQDLRYLMRRLLRLCPDAALLPSNPSFWRFVLSPEYYLYRAIITIMDGKTILDDLLSEGALVGEPALWEGDMLQEVVQVKRALQSINPTGDFGQIVSEYRRASRILIQTQSQNLQPEA